MSFPLCRLFSALAGWKIHKEYKLPPMHHLLEMLLGLPLLHDDRAFRLPPVPLEADARKVGCQLHSTFLSTLKHEILRNNFRQMLCIRQQQAHEIGVCVPVAFSPHHAEWVVKIGIHCQGNAATLCKRRLFCLNCWI